MQRLISVKLATKLIFIILAVVVFFIFYNNFLLDKSLAALDVSLNALKTSDPAAIGLLLNIKTANEITRENFNDSIIAELDYLNTVIAQRPKSDDAQMILTNLVNSAKEERAPLLNTLDASALAIRKMLNNTLGLIDQNAREKQIKIIDKIKQAAKAHINGDFEKAKELYNEILKIAPNNNYAYIINGLLQQLQQQLVLIDKRNNVLNSLKGTTDFSKKPEYYFELGLIETQLLNYKEANNSFNKVINVGVSSSFECTVSPHITISAFSESFRISS